MESFGVEMVATFIGMTQEVIKANEYGSTRERVNHQFEWKLVLTHNGYTFETPYRMGLAHCKHVAHVSPKQPAVKLTVDLARARASYGAKLTIADTEGYLVPNTPDLPSVLDCLQSDARAGEHMLFEDFADELGYDRDSRSAEKIWRQCQETRGRLQKMFGADFERFMSTDFDA